MSRQQAFACQDLQLCMYLCLASLDELAWNETTPWHEHGAFHVHMAVSPQS